MTQHRKISSPCKNNIQPTKHLEKQASEEHILVVNREYLFPAGEKKQGFFPENLDSYLAIITAQKKFLPRSSMETDPRYKQIIPYLIFTYTRTDEQPTYFLMQRKATASETRLRNKYSLGIGGHIRQEDLCSNSIFDWAYREFHEEVTYAGNLTVKALGILNDDSDEVGTVHLGLVLLLQGDSDQIRIKSELKQGSLFSLEECQKYAADMENWSKLVFEYLVKLQD
jgi:predicted NUDIX family phosphoesterase